MRLNYIYLQYQSDTEIHLATLPAPGIVAQLLTLLGQKIGGIDATLAMVQAITTLFYVDLDSLSYDNPVLPYRLQDPMLYVSDSRVMQLCPDEWVLVGWDIGTRPGSGLLSFLDYYWPCTWYYARDLPPNPPAPPYSFPEASGYIPVFSPAGSETGTLGRSHLGLNIVAYRLTDKSYYDGIYTSPDCVKRAVYQDWALPLLSALPTFPGWGAFDFVISSATPFRYYLLQKFVCSDPNAPWTANLSDLGGDWASEHRVDTYQYTTWSSVEWYYRVAGGLESHSDLFLPPPFVPVGFLPFLHSLPAVPGVAGDGASAAISIEFVPGLRIDL